MDHCLTKQQTPSLNRIKMNWVVVPGDHHEALLVFGLKNALMGYHLIKRNLGAVM